MPLISEFIASRHPAQVLSRDRGPRVCLTVRVPNLDTQAVRRALHRALGDHIDAYTLAVDTQHALTTLRLQVARGEVAALMDAIMAGVPQAEFGGLSAGGLPVLH
ncbi:hypothetical protein [Bordetella genomosp. 10]|uniref:hypothetical protein n=1 Tax=Bordetella genomosp. 10 TaxID=1416804 RepID=UPI00211AEB03|nr:hypothetical protein [Bordetella genomosp. 10]